MKLFNKLWLWLSLERASHLAQIGLAIVAIFGYFYTVVPVFQKERLAEQVADYEGQIKQLSPKISEAEAHLAQLQRERDEAVRHASLEKDRLTQESLRQRAEAQREQTRLIGELRNTERQLIAARDEKARIEQQTQFMVFRYRNLDGTPAVTQEQVRTAQLNDLRRDFRSALRSCWSGYGSYDRPFGRYGAYKLDSKDASYPFSAQERSIWKEFGTKYPAKVADDCTDTVAADYKKRYTQANVVAEIDSLRKETLVYISRAAAERPWSAPIQVEDLIAEMASARVASEARRRELLKKNEEDYGGWESALLPDRRTLLKWNYEVGKANAGTIARNEQQTVETAVHDKAKKLRTAIQEEVDRITGQEQKAITK